MKSARWVRQERSHIRALDAKYTIKWPKKYVDLFEQLRADSATMRVDKMRSFLKNHLNWLKKKLVEHRYWNNSTPVMDIHIDRIPSRRIHQAYIFAIEGGADELSQDFGPLLRRTFKEYAKERGIPFHPEVLERITPVLAGQALRGMGSLSMRAVENQYLGTWKVMRALGHEGRIDVKEMVREAIKGRRFTVNQKRSIKQWLIRNTPLIDKEIYSRLSIIGVTFTDDDYQRVTKEVREQFFVKLENEVIRPFSPKGTPPLKQTSSSRGSPSKGGTREQRLRAHQGRAAESTPTQRKGEIAARQAVAKTRGEPFIPTAFALQEIRKRSAATAELLEELLSNQTITPESVNRLFIAGSLAQRTFYDVIKNSRFLTQFPTSKIQPLLAWISMVGDRGVEQGKAKRALNERNSKDLFDFLDRNGFLEHHTHGTTIYLHRPQSGDGHT